MARPKANVFGFQDDAEKWRRHRINKRFLRRIFEAFEVLPFSLNAAYTLYMRYHAVHAQPFEDDEWRKMNVRNHLSAAIHRKLVVHLGPGKYRFSKKGIQELSNVVL